MEQTEVVTNDATNEQPGELFGQEKEMSAISHEQMIRQRGSYEICKMQAINLYGFLRTNDQDW